MPYSLTSLTQRTFTNSPTGFNSILQSFSFPLDRNCICTGKCFEHLLATHTYLLVDAIHNTSFGAFKCYHHNPATLCDRKQLPSPLWSLDTGLCCLASRLQCNEQNDRWGWEKCFGQNASVRRWHWKHRHRGMQMYGCGTMWFYLRSGHQAGGLLSGASSWRCCMFEHQRNLPCNRAAS